ncbi:MAG: hypothetical protein UW68_C0017G0011 [Candidatus Collierbacteria bacterium GW2011_GWB1_44_6]|uniref:CxxC-x17-CxxC domain-containing protein n=2 Tax=Candidatus Collieribacteriota TaxID=1752725 RepID=A0A0G1JNH0_9BACT|nr:MAG: hypothetical protein UV68_C0002G0027 [Candidatus Collierbacteria bacterium GW2011_GWC2_43_12]KKT73076.1 MAG: hypothetical protein UW68_C0017G0011 [Candidatus Collierbacteria bacterium GW2011_GWB1_44_6]KKT83211.1 MAG: hypothetical protein UW80_C0019G0021 [Microgenomates group bacterium GW2011_GWC1_44_9]
MTYSNRGNDRSRSTFYGKPFGDRNSDRGSERSFGQAQDRPTLHDAVCAKCGSACKVPFLPNGRKEVFCSKCFGEMNGDSRDSRGSGGSNYRENRSPRMYDNRDGGSNFAEKPTFEATCDQCHSRCQVPFRPTNGKPVLCSNCFAESKTDSRRPSSDNGSDIEAINFKLDKIIKLLSPATSKEASTEITERILEDIQSNPEVSLVKPKKKAKKVVAKD